MRGRLAAILVALSCTSAARGQEQDWNEDFVRLSKVPASFVQRAEKEAPGVKLARAYRDNEKGYRLFGKKDNGASVSVRFDRDGQLSYVRTAAEVAASKVPKVVANSLQGEIRGRPELDGFRPTRVSLVDRFDAVKKEIATYYEFFGLNGKDLYYLIELGKGGEFRRFKDLLLNPSYHIQRQSFSPTVISDDLRQEVLGLFPRMKLARVVKQTYIKSGMSPDYLIFGRDDKDRMIEIHAFGAGNITNLIEEVAVPEVPKLFLDAAQNLVSREKDLKGFRPVEARRMRRVGLGGKVSYLLYGDDVYGSPIKIEVDESGGANRTSDEREDWEVATTGTIAGEGIPPRGFAVLAARYGAVGWIDISDIVRASVPGRAIKIGVGGILPDPSLNQHKAMTLAYSINGKVGLSTIPDSGEVPLPPQSDVSKLVDVPPRGFAVLAANYGIGEHWIDVTETVRSRVAEDRLDVPVSEIPLPDPAVGQHKVMVIAYAEDGRVGLVVVHDSRKISLPLAIPPLNCSALEARKVEFPQKVSDVAYSSDGKMVVAGIEDGSIHVLDSSTGRETQRFEGHAPGRVLVTISTDGKLVLSGGSDKILRLWDLKTGKDRSIFRGHTEEIRRVALSPNGRLAASTSWEKTPRLWDTATGREIRKLEGHSEYVDGLAFTPDGRKIVTSSWDHTVRVWDVATGKELRKFEGNGGKFGALSLTKDGLQAFVGVEDGSVRRVDVASGREVKRYSTSGETGWALASMPDGSRFIATDGTSAILWDTRSDRMAVRLERHIARVLGIAISPDGKRAVTAGEDKTLRFWNLP